MQIAHTTRRQRQLVNVSQRGGQIELIEHGARGKNTVAERRELGAFGRKVDILQLGTVVESMTADALHRGRNLNPRHAGTLREGIAANSLSVTGQRDALQTLAGVEHIVAYDIVLRPIALAIVGIVTAAANDACLFEVELLERGVTGEELAQLIDVVAIELSRHLEALVERCHLRIALQELSQRSRLQIVEHHVQ